MLDWMVFKSSQANLQDNRTRQQNLVEQWTRRAGSGQLSPNEIEFQLFDRGEEQKEMVVAINGKRLKDETSRGLKTKADAIQIQPS